MDEFSPFVNYEELNLSSSSPDQELYEKTLIKGKTFFKCLASGCNKLFRFKSDMERHVVIHTNSRPYACAHPGCGKTFKRPDALKSHMHTHNEEIHLECPMPGCKAQFQKKSSLQYHLFKHERPNHFLCSSEGCHQTFTSYNDLKQHQKKDCEARKNSSPSSSAPSTKSQDSKVSRGIGSPDYEFEAIFEEEEEWNSKPTKALHVENKARKTFSRKESFDFDFSEVLSKGQLELNLDKTPTGSKFVKFLQIVCKVLMEENEELKNKLADQMINVQSRYMVDESPGFLMEHALDF